jgi:FKBP-type peptidyl-prolyl cis-trans isomerase
MNTALKAFIILALVGSLIGFSTYRNAQEPARLAHDHDGDGKDDHDSESHEAEAQPAEAQPVAPANQGTKPAPKAAAIKGKTRVTQDGLKIEELAIGSGKEAKPGQTVSVHYRGTLTNGSVFDESYKRGQPFQFALGGGQVIRGWDIGVAGMKEGGKRRLTIPPSLGYGPQGSPPVIPPNATLIFEVELLQAG